MTSRVRCKNLPAMVAIICTDAASVCNVESMHILAGFFNVIYSHPFLSHYQTSLLPISMKKNLLSWSSKVVSLYVAERFRN